MVVQQHDWNLGLTIASPGQNNKWSQYCTVHTKYRRKLNIYRNPKVRSDKNYNENNFYHLLKKEVFCNLKKIESYYSMNFNIIGQISCTKCNILGVVKMVLPLRQAGGQTITETKIYN